VADSGVRFQVLLTSGLCAMILEAGVVQLGRPTLKAKFLMLFTALTAAGCMTEGQFLASRQPTAMEVAVSRGQSEMKCPSAAGEVLSQEFTQTVQTPIVQAGYGGYLRSALRVAANGASIRSFAR